MPSVSSLIYDTVLSDYAFNQNSTFRQEQSDEKSPFNVDIHYAQIKNIENSEQREDFMSISLQTSIKNKQDYKRPPINCVVVMEASDAMSEEYAENKTKQSAANEIACAILDQLGDGDKFCLVTFSDSFKIEYPLDDVQSIGDLESIKAEITSIEPTGGSYDFDEGYNTALGQLQELFDAQIMAMTTNLDLDNADDDDKESETENRVILICENLPESNSSLMDLMQVYSDSDENKIYSSLLNIGNDKMQYLKLQNSVNKFRGCNMRQYAPSDDDQQSISDKIKSDFDGIINPIFFNVSLVLKSCKIDTVYGYHNNLKKLTKLNANGTVTTRKSLFLDDETSEVIAIRLQPEDDEEDQTKFDIELKYEDNDGNMEEYEREIVLSRHKEGIVDNDLYFDNTDIRKRIVLIKFVELLNEWTAKDGDLSNTDSNSLNAANLNVSDEFKSKFQAFLKYFNQQNEEIKDDSLNQEVKIMQQLIDFDENNAKNLRESASI